jgi:hypothetical protein
MPNGHGGKLRFGSPAVLLLALVVAGVLHHRSGAGWLVPAGYVLAALFGWRLAYHLHFWDASEYDGAYLPPEVKARAAAQCRVAAVGYALSTALVWFLVGR